MKTVENDFDKAYDELSKLYESETLEEKDGLKKAAVAAGLLASTAGLGACTPRASTPVDRMVNTSNSQVISQDSNSDSEYSSLSYNDAKGSSSNMYEYNTEYYDATNEDILSVLNAASDTKYDEQIVDENGDVVGFNTYLFGEHGTFTYYEHQVKAYFYKKDYAATRRVDESCVSILKDLPKDILVIQQYPADNSLECKLFITTETYNVLLKYGFPPIK